MPRQRTIFAPFDDRRRGLARLSAGGQEIVGQRQRQQKSTGPARSCSARLMGVGRGVAMGLHVVDDLPAATTLLRQKSAH